MKKIKLLIITLIIILIIITIALVVVLLYKNTEGIKQEDYSINHDKEMEEVTKIENEEDDLLIPLSSKSDYFIIKNSIDEYINCMNYIKVNPSEENKNRLYDKLDSIYTNYKNITNENIQEFYNDYAENSEFYIDKVYVKDINQLVNIYLVYGRLINKTDFTSQDYGFIMQSDKTNKTFSLILYDYMEENNLLNLKEGDLLDILTKESIDTNPYNTFEIKLYSEEDMVKEYFNKLKNDIEIDSNHLYNILNSEYKQKRFSNIEDFNKYIQDIKKKNIELKEYSFDEENNMYICKDQLGMYYIFDAENILEYTVILDDYTIDLPQFLEQYNNANSQEKVALNIQKFMKSINAKDYNYAYNCLSDSFKNNYFNTVEEFENYIIQNLYTNNEIEYVEFKEENEFYTYTIQITNMDRENESIEKTLIMKLNEGTDFELSFNV